MNKDGVVTAEMNAEFSKSKFVKGKKYRYRYNEDIVKYYVTDNKGNEQEFYPGEFNIFFRAAKAAPHEQSN